MFSGVGKNNGAIFVFSTPKIQQCQLLGESPSPRCHTSKKRKLPWPTCGERGEILGHKNLQHINYVVQCECILVDIEIS